MTQKKIFLSSEGDNWYNRNKSHINSDGLDVALGLKYASQIHDGKVLEIGSAGGDKLDQYALIGLKAYGVDPSQKAIEEGKKRYPNLNLNVGTADCLLFDDCYFDMVVFGFCLYLIDRSLLMRVVSEADRVLKNNGFLMITDFDPLYPSKRSYHHLPDNNIFSYKMSYERLFLSNPNYSLAEKRSYYHTENQFSKNHQERISTTILFKDLEQGYVIA